MLNIELKSLKFNKSFSRETNCFTAKLFLDGVHIADIENDGQGGATSVFAPDRGIDARIALQNAITKIDAYLLDQPFDLFGGMV